MIDLLTETTPVPVVVVMSGQFTPTNIALGVCTTVATTVPNQSANPGNLLVSPSDWQ